MSLRVFVACALACLLVGAGLSLYVWYGQRAGDGGAPSDPVAEPPIVAPAPEAVKPAAVPVQRPPAPAKGPVGKLTLPDGTEVDALNGVASPPAMTWGKGPYSPIVSTEHGNGYDWYVHADGTRTTTVELWRAELGRKDAVTLVYRPGEPAPADVGK